MHRDSKTILIPTQQLFNQFKFFSSSHRRHAPQLRPFYIQISNFQRPRTNEGTLPKRARRGGIIISFKSYYSFNFSRPYSHTGDINSSGLSLVSSKVRRSVVGRTSYFFIPRQMSLERACRQAVGGRQGVPVDATPTRFEIFRSNGMSSQNVISSVDMEYDVTESWI